MLKKSLSILSKLGLSEAFYYGPQRKKYLSPDFLLSDRYKKLMYEKVIDPSSFESFLDDAEESTDNYQFRHSLHIQKLLGSWRWKGMYQNREELVPIIFRENFKGIDLGGAYGPVSANTIIVDFAKRDIFGRPVRYNYLKEIDFEADFLYASHTLEHIPDLDELALQILQKLKPGAPIIIIVPAYSCVSWRVGNHTNNFHNDHVWSFYLSGTQITEPINNLLAIDTLLEKSFEIVLKKYAGDNSILLIAKR